jgi:hypothetical protein
MIIACVTAPLVHTAGPCLQRGLRKGSAACTVAHAQTNFVKGVHVTVHM